MPFPDLPTPAPSAIHILVVEDDPDLSDIYQRVLERLGPVRSCGDLGQALQSIHESAPDVVILDLGLPDSQGLEGLARIRAHAPGAAVVITTGASDENMAIEAMRNGAQDYLLKGRLEASTLVRSVRYALERKLAENKLRRSKELFSVITDNMVDLLSIIDARGTRLFASPSYQRLLDYSDEEMARMPIEGLVHPDDLARLLEAMRQILTEGTTRSCEYRIRHRDGTYLVVESNGARILDTQSGEPQVILVARDVTARKNAEAEHERNEVQIRQAQKLESIGQLAAGIAHEINTPTQYIGDNTIFLRDAFTALGQLVKAQQALLDRHEAGMAAPGDAAAVRKMAEEADLEFLMEEIPRAIAQTLEGVQRVTRIVGAMKEFSHPGTDTKTRTDLNRAIESTITVCHNEWKYSADLELDLDPELPFVLCLPSDFNQVILNLVINASHAIQERQAAEGAQGGEARAKGLIQIRTRHGEGWVEIQVQDSGCGIPDPIQPRIFDPFFTTKSVGKGTGQGLSIVHSAVTKHGGSIRFETTLGQGTTFFVRLPVLEEGAPPTGR